MDIVILCSWFRG